MRVAMLTILALLPLTSNAGPSYSARRVSTATAVERSERPDVKTQEAECGEETEVYENHTRVDLCVTITVTDSCEPWDSTVTVQDEDGHEVAEMEVPDGGSKTGSFTVPAGGMMELECAGDPDNGGCCDYQILVDPFCESGTTLGAIEAY